MTEKSERKGRKKIVRENGRKKEREKPSARRESNPQPYYHEANVLPLRYNRGPKSN